MKEKVMNFNEINQLFEKGDTLFLAVSGGPDSLALLYFFASIQKAWNLQLHTLTVDHQLRGETSKEDAHFVYEQSKRLGIPCTIGEVDVNQYKQLKQKGTQEAARELRYQFFIEQLKSHPHAKLVLGHHEDDLVESITMQFIKGVRQKGIPVKRKIGNNLLIRPFLCLTKSDLIHFLNELKISPRIDESNEDLTYTRNRIRKTIIPLLKNENPSLNQSLIKVTDELNEDDAYLTQLAEQSLREIANFYEQKVTFSLQSFIGYPQPLQRRMFHLILNYLQSENYIEKDYFYLFKEWISSEKTSSQLHIKQCTITKSYDICEFTKGKIVKSDYEVKLNLNDKTTLPNGWTFEVKENKDLNINGHAFICSKQLIKFPLTLRPRRPGDTIRPLGLNGTKKVKKVFIDKKIPMQQRDEWPIVENGDGQILWIPFIVKSELANNKDEPTIVITVQSND